MNRNIVIKIVSIIVPLLLCSVMLLGNFAFAEEPTVKDAMDTWGNDETAGGSGVVGKTKSILGTIITVMRYIGYGIAIIMLTYVAIKYMTAAPEGKAEFKKSATGYIVGAVILFATSGILGVIQTFSNTVVNS